MSRSWAHIDSGAKFHALVGALLLSDDQHTKVFDRLGPDGGIDAFSAEGTTVYQSKHHQQGTAATAIADAGAELDKIRVYRQSANRWQALWQRVTGWKLITNVAFGPADEGRWRQEIAPAFAQEGLNAEYGGLPYLDSLLAQHPGVADAFFGQRPRMFVTLAEHRDLLRSREVLARSYDIPLQGRDHELDAIRSFVASQEHRVLLVHGPGGLGKSRLLHDAAWRLLEEGAVDTVYCATPNIEVRGDWYVGIQPDANALVIVDEPTDAAFVERFLSELQVRARRWKVLAGARTPKDPVIRPLTSGRDRLVAPALELKPLAADDSTRYAANLLEPLPIAPETRPKMAKWLSNVCGRFPIWMTVAAHLLEDRDDIRDLPTDEFDIPRRYIGEIVDHTRPELANARQTLSLLRWIALIQPVNRTERETLTFLATATDLKTPAAVDALVQDLSRRRALRTYGIDHRMIEVVPDVLRDFLLIDWLTHEEEGRRKPSFAALDLAQRLARDVSENTSAPFIEQIVRSLGRMEFLVQPPIRLLDPVADVAVSLAEAARDTLEQERILEFAKLLAFLRPGHFARVAEHLRIRDVAEGAHDTIFARFVVPRRRIVEAIPRELAIAARGATSRTERLAILRELVSLIDLQANIAGPDRRMWGIEPAADVLKHVIHNRHGYRSANYSEAAELARLALDDLEHGESPRTSWKVLLGALVEIDRHESYSDGIDEDVLQLETFALLPDGEPGQIVEMVRDRLWSLATNTLVSRVAKHFAWTLLGELHVSLNRARTDPRWRQLLSDDLMLSRVVAGTGGADLEDLQGARALWAWHVEHEDDPSLRNQANACEAAYLLNPLVSKYAPLFGRTWTAVTDEPDPARVLPATVSVSDLETFFSEALRFTSTHVEQWRDHRVHVFAWDFGHKRGGEPLTRVFMDKHLRAGTHASLFRVALAMAGGHLRARRHTAGPDAFLGDLLAIAANCTDEDSTMALYSSLYVESPSSAAKGFRREDLHFVLGHLHVLHKFTPEQRYLVLGRLATHHVDALSNAEAELDLVPAAERAGAVTSFWRGFYDALPLQFSSTAVPAPLMKRMLALSFKAPDLEAFARGQFEWELRQILAQATRLPLADLVAFVHERHRLFGDHNSRDRTSGGFGQIHLLPRDESCLYEAFDVIREREAHEEDRNALRALLQLAELDATVMFDLPGVLSTLDPDGQVVPAEIVERIRDAPSLDCLLELCAYAKSYFLNGRPWRIIALAACSRAVGIALSDDDQRYVHSALAESSRSGFWSGSPKELHPRWQQAVDDAEKALRLEESHELKPFWQWRLDCAQRDLVVERGRMEERGY